MFVIHHVRMVKVLILHVQLYVSIGHKRNAVCIVGEGLSAYNYTRSKGLQLFTGQILIVNDDKC